jgi:Tol biopolymer transport system component
MEDTMLRRLVQTSPARVVAGFSIALVAAACGESPTEQTWMEPALAVVQGFGADPTAACSPISSFLLIADNGGLEVGSVRVANNESNLFVTFETDEWQVTETHLFVGTAVSDIPTARGGNPLPGKFPYMNQHGTGTTSYTYAVPLSELGGAESIIVAAHADIALGELEEGAWGEGDMIVPDKSWGMYFAYQIVDCASGLIGIEGGVLESEGVTVTIPEGALDASEEISFHSVDASSLPEGAIEGTAYDFRPDGLVFNDPGVEIVVEYDDTGMTVAEEEALALFLLNDGVWERVEDSAVNPLENTITAWVTHFSVYAVVPAVAELSLSVTPQPVQEQEQLTHDVSIENLSGSQLTGLEVRVLAKGLVNTPQAPSYCSALGIDSGPDAPALLFICTLDVATGATEDFQVSLRPQAGAQGTVIESHAEFDYGTQTASSPIVTTTVEAPTGGADLSVSIVDTPDPVTAGSTLSYDLMVANAGPDGVTDVTVGFKIYHASLLPSPMTFSTGCSLFGKAADHYLVLCQLASLPSSSNHTFTIDLEPTDLGTLTSEASIDSWTGPADPNLADNEDTEDTEVVSATGLDGHVLFTSNRDGSNDVYVKNLASGAVTRLTAGENAITAEWSPDGTKVAYASQPATGNDYDIRVLTIATMQIETVATGFRAHNPTWSPDGTRLAYTSNDGVTLDWDIHVVDLNTLSDVVVADSDETDREPAWSPDGTRIAFQRDYGFGVFEVLSVDLASDVTSLLYAGTIEDLAWSPDGSKIAGRQWKNQTPVYEIVVLDLGTNVLSTITTEESIATDPIWSPSGGQLVFSLRDPTTGTYDIHVVGATGGSISLVESSPANDFSAGWRLAY